MDKDSSIIKDIIHIVILILCFSPLNNVHCQNAVNTHDQNTNQNSLYFIESNTVYTTQATWLTTFLISFDPYETYINNLRADLRSLSDLIYYYIDNSFPPGQGDTSKTDKLQYLKLAKERIAVFHHKINELDSILKNTLALIGNTPSNHSRQKRALFSFLGTILKGISGVATEKDIRKINLKMTQLANSNLQLTHILEDSVTIINATRVKLDSTIHTVNALTQVTNNLQKQFTRIMSKLSTNVKEYEKFAFHWNQINTYFNILQDSVHASFRHFETLYSQISDVLHQKLTPTLIEPIQLHKILIHISETISKSLTLPYDINGQLLLYYQHIKCSLVKSPHGIIVIMAIPLLSDYSKYTVYQALNIPVTSKQQNISVLYDLPFDKFAVSEDKTKYAILDFNTFHKCSQPGLKFCDFGRAVTSITNSLDSCLFQMLFNQDPSRCSLKIFHTTIMYPQAYLIGRGHWVISTHTDMIFTVLCLDNSKRTVNIYSPVGLIKLDVGCKAVSTLLTLPIRFIHEEKVFIRQISYIPRPNITAIQYHSQIHTEHAINYKLPDKVQLSGIDDQSVNSLLTRLHSHAQEVYTFKRDIQKSKLSLKTIIIIILSTALGVLILAALIYLMITSERFRRLLCIPCGRTIPSTLDDEKAANGDKIDAVRQVLDAVATPLLTKMSSSNHPTTSPSPHGSSIPATATSSQTTAPSAPSYPQLRAY